MALGRMLGKFSTAALALTLALGSRPLCAADEEKEEAGNANGPAQAASVDDLSKVLDEAVLLFREGKQFNRGLGLEVL